MGLRTAGTDEEQGVGSGGAEPLADERTDDDSAVDDVAAMYRELAPVFQRGWAKEGHRSLHVGYYDEAELSPREAAMRTIRTLADAAAIDGSDRVLDVGCGAGEDAVRLAREREATVVGVDVGETVLELARENAREHGVADPSAFRRDDFHELSTVADDSVDVVWGLEALAHADDLDGVLDQVERVLRDDGRLAFADFFTRTGDLEAPDRRRLATIGDALPVGYGPIDEFRDALEERGFREVEIYDGTDAVRPCTKRRYRFSLAGYLVGRLLRPVGIASDTFVAYSRATIAMHRLVERGTLGYYFVTARR